MRRKRVATGLRIEIDGDRAFLAAPRALMQRAMDLSLLNYVDCDGCISTTIHDPIENAGSQAANGAVRKVRRAGRA